MTVKQRQPKSQRANAAQTTRRPRASLLDAESERLARKGERLYRTKLKALLEPEQTGMFAAIEVDSGDYFLGARIGEAIAQARAKYPDRLVYIVRIGFRAAVKLRNRRSL